MVRFEAEYAKTAKEVSRSEGLIKNLEGELNERSRGIQISKTKEMKISTTIEDLRQTLERQIEDKDRTIKVYEGLIDNIRLRLTEKIGG